MRIAILDDYQRVALELADWSSLGERCDLVAFDDHMSDEGELVRRLAEFDVIVIMRERTPFGASLLRRLPCLKLLVTTGMRNQAIDLAAASEMGVTVCGTEANGRSTIELTWALILSLMRGIPNELQSVRGGGWQVELGGLLQGKTLGLLGLGRLGSGVAAIGRAFEMDVIAWSANLTGARAEAAGARLADSKDSLMASADVISIHLVLGERTRGLVDHGAIGCMKAGAFLVNTSRSQIVDESALVEALRDRRIAGAGIDVFAEEPLPAKHPFRTLPNVMATPHIGYVSREHYALFYRQAVEDIAAFAAGNPIRTLATPDVA